MKNCLYGYFKYYFSVIITISMFTAISVHFLWLLHIDSVVTLVTVIFYYQLYEIKMYEFWIA
jgi:hypothetical protein